MAGSANLFENFWDQALATPVNYPSDDIRAILLVPTATPNLGTWVHYSDVVGELATGNGYTAGGVALASKTHAVTLANSWSATWAASTAYVYGQLVKPPTANGYLYMCDTAGTSGTAAPTFPTTPGQDVADNTANWSCVGESVTIWSSAAAQWTATSGNTISAGFAVLYDNTPATAATKPLIGLVNFGGTLSATGAALTVSPDPTYGWFLTTPF